MSRIMRGFRRCKNHWFLLGTTGAVVVVLLLTGGQWSGAQQVSNAGAEDAKIRTGFAIAPVPLDLRGKNPTLVGLGSYIVNGQSSCSECHTWPIFAPGGNPYLGEPEQINTAGYLAGGRVFPPNNVVSRNITPDPVTGLPAGLTYDEFEMVMRTGIDLDGDLPHIPSDDLDLLQVMPWPVFANMTDRDMRAVYEYLSAVPSVP